jgi:hypothetical protein
MPREFIGVVIYRKPATSETPLPALASLESAPVSSGPAQLAKVLNNDDLIGKLALTGCPDPEPYPVRINPKGRQATLHKQCFTIEAYERAKNRGDVT